MADLSNSSRSCTDNYSRNDEGHFEWTEGMVLANRYHITRLLGDGTFGRVVEVRDSQDGALKAIKIIRAVARYSESAKVEAKIIKRLQRSDPEGNSKLVRLLDTFDQGQNYCLVFERLGRSLFDVIKWNRYRGFRMSEVKAIARQLFQALEFMHTKRLTHTDLKPENILFVHDDFDLDNSRNVHRPRSLEVKVIDFGGATFHDEHHSAIINTRQYRAPEVILGLGWSEASDLWSLGCILVELYTGEMLFPTHDNYEHLAMIEHVIGRIPMHMARNSDRTMRKFFDERYVFNWPKLANSTRSERAVRKLKYLEELIPSKYKSFREIIYDCLEINPHRRLRPSDALREDFLREE